MTTAYVEDTFDDITTDAVESSAGPLPGSRGTRAGVSDSRSGRRARKPSKAKVNALQEKLSAEMFTVGTMAGLAFPVTGMYIAQESDAFTKAIVELAARRPEWTEALEHLADVQPGLVIGRTALGIGAALAVDRGRADPEKRFMRLTGVWQAWKAIDDKRDGYAAEGSAYVPPPPAWQPV